MLITCPSRNFDSLLLVFPRPLEDAEAEHAHSLVGYWSRAAMRRRSRGELPVERPSPDRLWVHQSSRDTNSRDVWRHSPLEALGDYFAHGSPANKDGTRTVPAFPVLPERLIADPDGAELHPRPGTGRRRPIRDIPKGVSDEWVSDMPPQIRAMLFR